MPCSSFMKARPTSSSLYRLASLGGGLGIPLCNFAVRYGRCDTDTALIQSQGRICTTSDGNKGCILHRGPDESERHRQAQNREVCSKEVLKNWSTRDLDEILGMQATQRSADSGAAALRAELKELKLPALRVICRARKVGVDEK